MKKQVKRTLITALLTLGVAGITTGVVALASSQNGASIASQTQTKTESVYAPAKALKNIYGCTFESGVVAPEEALEDYRGVKVTTGKGVSTFEYNSICNLKENGDFISFLFLPEEMGVVETDDLVITLTDIYDPSKYITIDFFDGGTWSSSPMTSWIAFSESGKYDPFGYEWDGSVLDTGTSCAGSWRGAVSSVNALWQTTQLYYDVEEKAIFALYYKRTNGGSIYNESAYGYKTKKLLFDFDDKKYLGANIFEGFTTGEVYITVDVTASESAHFLITNLGGVDLSVDELSPQAPAISFDYDGYDKTALPYGVAGESTSYPVFDAIAYAPIDGEFSVQEISVLYGAESIPVVDGRFATKKAGIYTVNYTAVSSRGVSVRESLSVFVKERYEQAPTYEVNQEIPTVAYVGTDRVYLPDGEVYGGFGRLRVDCSLTADGKEVEILQEGNAKYFIPEISDGAQTIYTLTYRVTDITENVKEVQQEIVVEYPQTPVIKQVSVPTAIRKGYATSFAKTSAEFVVNGEKVDVPVKVRVNGTFLAEDLTYTPTEAGVLTVEYVAYHPSYPNDESKATILPYEVAVLTLKETLSSTSYFYTQGMEYDSVTNTSVVYKKTAENATFTYANALAAAKLSFSFDMDKNTSKGISVIVQDSVEPAQKLEFVIQSMDGIPVVTCGEDTLGSLAGSFTEQTSQQMVLSYDNYAFDVYGKNNDYIGKITHYANGLPFKGFTSGTVYVTFVFDERSEMGAKFSIYSLNGHTFSRAEGDKISPVIALKHNLSTLRYEEYGASVLVSAATAVDVFGVVESLKVKIVAPNKAVVYEGDISEDYFLTVDKYGIYNITYTAIDDSDKKTTLRISVSVQDTQAPTIENNIKFNAQYSVGDTLKLPTISATDNKDAEVGTYYVIILPTGEWKVVSGTYTFEIKGNYVIRAVAVDEAMNTSYQEFSISVR